MNNTGKNKKVDSKDIQSILAGASNILGGSSGNTTTVGNVMQGLGSVASFIPGIGGAIGAGVSMLGNIINQAFGSNINDAAVDQAKDQIKAQSSMVANTNSMDSLLDQWGSYEMDYIDQDSIGTQGWFSNKASKITSSLNRGVDEANARALNNLRLGADTVNNNIIGAALANMQAKGGGIHIAKNKRGTFKAQASKMGMSVQEAARHILANKDKYSPAMRKKANFARNFAHGDGGYLFDTGGPLNTHGTYFPIGFTSIDEGGTHEQNPLGGVIIGYDEQGIPNMVEEGETKYNDYIFSDRLKAPEKLLTQVNLPKNMRNKTFSDISKKLSKEYEERPNDPISKRGFEDSMNKLIIAQEMVRSKDKTKNNKSNKFDRGGIVIQDLSHLGDDLEVGYEQTGFKPSILASKSTTGWDEIEMPVNDNKGSKLAYLRYVPTLGSGIMSILDLAGVTNKPDYTYVDELNQISRSLPTYQPKYLSNYLTFKPLDRNYYQNKLDAQAAATRRSIENNSAGNRATAMANLIAADYNSQIASGNLARQAEEYNRTQEERVAAFNRGTNQYNSELGARAYAYNLDRDKTRIQSLIEAANMRDRIDQITSNAKSINLTNFLDSLGDIGNEEFNMNVVKNNPALLYYLDRLGTTNYKGNDSTNTKSKSKGGYLTINKSNKKKRHA